MAKRDLFFSLAAAFLISLFLLPTLINTGIYNKLPISPVLVFGSLPFLVVGGMLIASFLSKRLSIMWQVAKFGLVGVLNTSVDFGIFNLLIAITNVTQRTEIILINATSFSVAMVNSYFWNRDWVFGSQRKNNFLIFFIVTTIGLSINSGTVYLLTTHVKPILVDSPVLWANFAKVLATVLSLVWNFSGYRFIVFKK